jgi:hypothetical protein
MAVKSAVKLALLCTRLAKVDQDDVDSDDKAKRLRLIVAMLTDENCGMRSDRLSEKVHAMDAIRRSTPTDD